MFSKTLLLNQENNMDLMLDAIIFPGSSQLGRLSWIQAIWLILCCLWLGQPIIDADECNKAGSTQKSFGSTLCSSC